MTISFLKRRAVHLFSRMTVPHSWTQFTQENIARSQREREASARLRGEIDSLLRHCANAMWSQFNSVNNSFSARLNEANDAKNKLQAHLQQVVVGKWLRACDGVRISRQFRSLQTKPF